MVGILSTHLRQVAGRLGGTLFEPARGESPSPHPLPASGAREQTANAGTSLTIQARYSCLRTKFDFELQTRVRAPPRDAPGVLTVFPPAKGVGNAGCPWHPQPPVQQESTGVEAAGPPESPGIPARNGFNGFLRALPGDHAWLPPSSADRSADLAPASERQDHTTSPSAPAPVVCVPDDRSRAEARPVIPCTPDAAASTASRPASVTIASRPLMGRDGNRIRVIWVNRETIYFCAEDSTGFRARRFFACRANHFPSA
jgi:hypothetical protein